MKLVIQNLKVATQFELHEGENFIGRKDPESGLAPSIDLDAMDSDQKISRMHAMVVYAKAKILLKDMGSLNGTYVLGHDRSQRKLVGDEELELKVGDQFVVGSIVLKLEK